MKMVQWVGRLVSNNFWWKVLAVGIAMVVWVLVASEPELSTFATAHLEYKNLPDELEISSEPVSKSCWNCAAPPESCAAWATEASIRRSRFSI
jgi:hypothetical protein